MTTKKATAKQKKYNFAVVLNYQAWEAMEKLCGPSIALKLLPHYRAIEKELTKRRPS